MPPTCLAIVNLSTASPLSAALTPDWLSGLATALAEQAVDHIAPAWGVSWGVRVSDGTDIQVGEGVLALVDGGPPDALGWHDEEGNDVPVGYVDLSLETDLDSTSQTASHEAGEMLGNPNINLWADNGNGIEMARELSDAVESNRYTASNGYALSDFVLPSFFDPMGSAPFSFMQAQPNADPAGPWPPGPFQTALGGYQNVRNAGAPIIGAGVTPPTGRAGKRAYEGTHTARDRSFKLDMRKWSNTDRIKAKVRVRPDNAPTLPAPDGT